MFELHAALYLSLAVVTRLRKQVNRKRNTTKTRRKIPTLFCTIFIDEEVMASL